MKYYQAEMHSHTSEVSVCSSIPARYLVQAYVELGYKYLFITDHYNPWTFRMPLEHGFSWDETMDHFLSGYKAAAEAAKGTDLKVMLAMELTREEDGLAGIGTDFLVFGVDEQFLRENPWINRQGYKEMYDQLHEAGFLVFQAHPYRYGMEPVQPICYDGVEVVNAHPKHHSRNRLAITYAQEHDLYTIGGSDVHSEQDVGRGGIMLPGGIESPMDLVQYYRENGSPELIVTFGA